MDLARCDREELHRVGAPHRVSCPRLSSVLAMAVRPELTLVELRLQVGRRAVGGYRAAALHILQMPAFL